LRRAGRLVKTKPTGLLDIEFDAGYESHEAFTRAFTERFGIAPSSYREQISARLQSWEQAAQSQPTVSVQVAGCEARRVACGRHRGDFA